MNNVYICANTTHRPLRSRNRRRSTPRRSYHDSKHNKHKDQDHHRTESRPTA